MNSNSSSNSNNELPSSSGSTSLHQTQDESAIHLFPANSEVVLMKDTSHVGWATVLEGTVLHGTNLPSGFIKVIIKEIIADIPPPIRKIYR